ncbi:MAG: hydrogenase nickel insertion protein HypA [Deltaproteobacteria bacterium]|jgi:hydrogenase nickel incorporation protein HypA/HybF|nr:hydrogenase nickel insertion protein HypA [Deltaproteobacteria bacterium]
MHEMSIAQSLMEILREEMEKHDAKVLKSVHLQIGQLSAIVPEALSFCFQVMAEGTEMEGAKLVMDVIALRGRCPECRKEFEIEDYHFACPTCGSTRIETIAGQDLAVADMEVE